MKAKNQKEILEELADVLEKGGFDKKIFLEKTLKEWDEWKKRKKKK